MENNSNNSNNFYSDEYLPWILKVGRITTIIAVLASFLPILVLTLIFKVTPEWSQIFGAFVSMASIVGLFWVIEPIAYFPILGLPGTFLAFVSGNIGNLRIPVAAASVKAAGMEPGTDESSIIATIGIGVSIVVNIVLLTICVLIGKTVLASLPPSILGMLTYLLPALFGAVFAQFAVKNFKIAGVALTISLIMTFLMKTGKLSFLPGLPTYAVIFISVFGTILVARLTHKSSSSEE